MFLTQEQALSAVNRRLKTIGGESIGRTTFYMLRDIYLKFFPKTQWLKNGRLLYGEPVVRFLYFMARLHYSVAATLKRPSVQATELAASEVIKKLPKGAKFSDAFGSYSAIDTFFEQQQAA